MHDAMLKITKSAEAESGLLIMGTGKYHYWHFGDGSPAPKWFGASSGIWTRRTNSTKFRQFSYLELQDTSNNPVANVPEFPYTNGQKFVASLISRWLFLQFEGDSFDVTVLSAPPQTKKFKLCETWSGALSWVVLQKEILGIRIVDLQLNTVASYIYNGNGLSIGPPIKKLPNTLPAVTARGDWNDFEAPGWMLADDFEGDAFMQSASLALGTSISWNCFEFAGHVDNYPGYWGKIPSFSTGRTIGLPSGGFSSGRMSLVEKATHYSGD